MPKRGEQRNLFTFLCIFHFMLYSIKSCLSTVVISSHNTTQEPQAILVMPSKESCNEATIVYLSIAIPNKSMPLLIKAMFLGLHLPINS